MKTKCMSCGGSMKKMAVGGTTTKRIIKKSTGGMYGIPQENLGTSGQYGFAKKGGTHKMPNGKVMLNSKMQNGGTTKADPYGVSLLNENYKTKGSNKSGGKTNMGPTKIVPKKVDPKAPKASKTRTIKRNGTFEMKTGGTVKPLMKAQKGKIVKTFTPFQNYMKTPGAIASDTTQSFTGSRDGSKPVLDKAYNATYYAGRENERRTGNDKVKYDANGKRVYKKGGATKAAKFAALAPPYNKATFADRIVGAKKKK